MALDTTPDISVVICAYTEERWYELVAAVESIQRQTISPREIVVVIDHNTQLFERARTYIPNVSLIESSEPKGLSGSRNSGIAVAKGSLIAFLDDDAIAEPDWLERLGDCCRNPEVLGAGGVVEPLWASKRPLWFPREFYWVIGCSYQDQLSAVKVVRNPYGGCTCIRREVFETVGGFRDGIGRVGNHLLGGEETELCIRAAQHWPHKVFLCDPGSRIHHHVSPQRASWRYFHSRCYAEGLSKAIVSRYVGVKDSLSSERVYTCYMLPRGIIRGLTNAVLHRELAGLLQAGAIITGFVITTLGFLVGNFSQRIGSGQRISSGINSPLQTLPAHE